MKEPTTIPRGNLRKTSPDLKLTHFLLPFQSGVGTKGGVEPVIRAAQRALDNSLGRPFTHRTSLDFSNAFKTVDRREIASGPRRFAPSLYRAGKWACVLRTQWGMHRSRPARAALIYLGRLLSAPHRCAAARFSCGAVCCEHCHFSSMPTLPLEIDRSICLVRSRSW
jgi:hypothetical protein